MSQSNVVPLTEREQVNLPAPTGNAMPVSALMPVNMEQAMRLAELMSAGKLVPEHLQKSPADCLMVIEQAARWRMSPFAVAQATSSVRGKLMFEGKLVAAAIHTSGILVGRLQYQFRDAGPKRTVTVSGQIRGEAEPKTVDVMLEAVATENGCWKKQPDQQLCYSGARVWARRHAPEVMLGVYSPEEDFEEDAPPAAVAKGRVERETYPDASFDTNFPAWERAIKAGKKTPDDVIATVESKSKLSDDQKAKIRAVVADAQKGAQQ